jgi:hypothetical protein
MKEYRQRISVSWSISSIRKTGCLVDFCNVLTRRKAGRGKKAAPTSHLLVVLKHELEAAL